MRNLPPWITLHQHARRNVTLKDCAALQLHLKTDDPERSQSLIVWRDGPKYTRPAIDGQRITELRPGDEVVFQGKRETIVAVEIYR